MDFEGLCDEWVFFFIVGERVDTSIFCSSAVKSNRSSSDLSQPHICVTPYAEQIKDIQSENQVIDNVLTLNGKERFALKIFLVF